MAAPNKIKKPVVIEFTKTRIFYKCPKCGKIIQQKRKTHHGICIECGQYLDWQPANDISAETITTEDPDEAAWIAHQYYEACKTKPEYRIDIDEWRHDLKGDQIELYLLFKNKKPHGVFMRKYSKEAPIYDG